MTAANIGAGLLLVAGVQKLRHRGAPAAGSGTSLSSVLGPGLMGVVALAEITCGALWLAVPGRATGAFLAGTFSVLALTAALIRVRDGTSASCNCFGSPAPLTWFHASANAGFAAVATWTIPAGPQEAWASQPLPVILIYGSGLASAVWLSYVLLADGSEYRELFRSPGGVS